jgi:hypothetical protein
VVTVIEHGQYCHRDTVQNRLVIALVHREGYTQRIPVARNPSLGNLGFAVKREKLEKSLLKSNYEIADMLDWTEEQIRKRATRT